MGIFTKFFSSLTRNNAPTLNFEDNSYKIIFFDLETTGLSCNRDEILQLSIIDECGNVLFNEYFNPDNHTSWPKAEAVNGITPTMVVGKPSFKEKLDEIQRIFNSSKTIAGYNIGFDINFLNSNGVKKLLEKKRIDVMEQYQSCFGESAKLTNAAKNLGYKFTAHDSLEDIKATLYVYNELKSQDNNVASIREKRMSHEEYLLQKIGDKTIAEIQNEEYEEIVKRKFKKDTPEFQGLHIFSNTYPPKEGFDILNDTEKALFSALVDGFKKMLFLMIKLEC